MCPHTGSTRIIEETLIYTGSMRKEGEIHWFFLEEPKLLRKYMLIYTGSPRNVREMCWFIEKALEMCRKHNIFYTGINNFIQAAPEK